MKISEAKLRIREESGNNELGLVANMSWHLDPKHLVFMLSRYKFVAKMLSGKKHVLEIGCGDAFCTRIVLQEVNSLVAIDADGEYAKEHLANRDSKWSFELHEHDILLGPVEGGSFDAAYSIDVIEHIENKYEDMFMENIASSLSDQGICIIGTPSLESQKYASAESIETHVNCKNHKQLKELVSKYFHNVFLFSMNDEVVHTGFYPMAHYLWAIGVGKK